MPTVLIACWVALGLVAAVPLVRRLLLRLAERRHCLSVALAIDTLIAQCENPDDPLHDLRRSVFERRWGEDAEPYRIRTSYVVFPTRRHHLAFDRILRDGQVTYLLYRWKRDAGTGSFQPWFLGDIPCRSPWFVERMKRLTGLLDAYPRRRLVADPARDAWPSRP